MILCVRTFLSSSELENISRKTVRVHLERQMGVTSGVDFDKDWLKAEIEVWLNEAKAADGEGGDGSSPEDSDMDGV